MARALVVFAIAAMAVMATAETAGLRANARNRVSSLSALKRIHADSALGKSVLLQLGSRIQTGAPLDEINELLDSIRSALEAEFETATTEFNGQVEACATSDAHRAAVVADLEQQVADLNATLSTTSELIDGKTAEIASLKDDIEAKETRIAEIKAEQEAMDATRATQHGHYVDRKGDLQRAIEAVEGVKAEVEKSGFADAPAPTENEEEAAAAEDVDGDDAMGLVELAERVEAARGKDVAVNGFLQVAANLARQAETHEDAQALLGLLDELLEILHKELQNVKDAEATHKADYETLTELNANRTTTLESQKASLEAERETAKQTKLSLQSTVTTKTQELSDTIGDLHTEREGREAHQAECAHNAELFEGTRAAHNDALAVLEKIQKMVDETLAPALSDENVSGTVSGVSHKD